MANAPAPDLDKLAQCWAEKDYRQAESLHRQLIEQASDVGLTVRSHYWYLGLALLLQGQEEEAQMTWMLPLMEAEAEQADAWTMELLEILEGEASRLAEESPEAAFLTRQHIHVINPQNINNTLLLVVLSIRLEQFDSQNLDDWNLVEGLQTSAASVDENLIAVTLNALLQNGEIDDRVIHVIAAAIAHVGDRLNRVVPAIMQTANRVAFGQKKPDIAVKLAELCLPLLDPQVEDEQRSVLMQLSSFYQEARQYEEAIATAKQSYELSKTVPDKIAAIHRCLSSQLLTGGYWYEGYAYFQQEQELLDQFLQQPPDELDEHTILRLMTSPFFQPYFQDIPRENRTLQNRLMAYCQSQLQRIHADRISRYQGRSHPKTPTSEPLKVGYLSHCLKRHSVGWISRWLFQYHNRDQVKVHLYLVGSETEGSDSIQDWFVDHADVAHRMPADPVAIADQIYDDQIDVLVELDSITLDATCAVLALKPAPVQVSWLGWDAPGLPAVDYYIVDSFVVPDDADGYYTEKLWRMPHTYVAVDGFEVGVPSLRRGDLDIPADAVVYLSTQRGHKLHPDSVRLQLQIVGAVPNSYLLVKLSGQEESLKAFWLGMAEEVGVGGDRLRFLPDVPSELTHRANLRLADVVLDTYPYNGATTTLETLWMELPLVTRVGQQFSSRNSYTMMRNAGISEGIAWTDAEYVDWGIRLGQNAGLRQQIAWKLRQSKQSAPLWNAEVFTSELENAFRKMLE